MIQGPRPLRFILYFCVVVLTFATHASAQYANLFLPRAYWRTPPDRIPAQVVARARTLTAQATAQLLRRIVTPVLSADQTHFERVRFFEQLPLLVSEVYPGDLAVGAGTLRACERYFYQRMLTRLRAHPRSDPTEILRNFASGQDAPDILAEEVFFTGSDIDVYVENNSMREAVKTAVERLAVGGSSALRVGLREFIPSPWGDAFFQEVQILVRAPHMSLLSQLGGSTLDTRSFSLRTGQYVDSVARSAVGSVVDDFFRGIDDFVPSQQRAQTASSLQLARQLRHCSEAPWLQLSSAGVVSLLRSIDAALTRRDWDTAVLKQLDKFARNAVEDGVFERFHQPRTAVDRSVLRLLEAVEAREHRRFIPFALSRISDPRTANASTEPAFYVAASSEAALGALRGTYLAVGPSNGIQFFRDQENAFAVAGGQGFVLPVQVSSGALASSVVTRRENLPPRDPTFADFVHALRLRAQSRTVPIAERIKAYEAYAALRTLGPALHAQFPNQPETPEQFIAGLSIDRSAFLSGIMQANIINSLQVLRPAVEALAMRLTTDAEHGVTPQQVAAFINRFNRGQPFEMRLMQLVGDSDFGEVAERMLGNALLESEHDSETSLRIENGLRQHLAGPPGTASVSAGLLLWRYDRDRDDEVPRAWMRALEGAEIPEAIWDSALQSSVGRRSGFSLAWVSFVRSLLASPFSHRREHALAIAHGFGRSPNPEIEREIERLLASVHSREPWFGAHLGLVLGLQSEVIGSVIFREYSDCGTLAERAEFLRELRQSALLAPRTVAAMQTYVPVFVTAARDVATQATARAEFAHILHSVMRGVELEKTISGLVLFEDLMRSGLLNDSEVDGYVRGISPWEHSPYVNELLLHRHRVSARALREAFAQGRSFRDHPAYCALMHIPKTP